MGISHSPTRSVRNSSRSAQPPPIGCSTARANGQPHGISTTKAGIVLKRQISVRTFADWNDAAPGFFEADLVANCGERPDDAFYPRWC
jgi:hypothetical protein